MREVGPFVLLLCACGAAVREPAPASSAAIAPPAAVPAPSASASAAEALAAFEALAARAPTVAPGMHEIARTESGAEPVELRKAEAHDGCLRVAFAASAPVVAALLDQGGTVLATTDGAATEGVLAERGPVCVRKGDAVRGRAQDLGAGARVRWMAWEAR